jgi:hypothetical protein
MTVPTFGDEQSAAPNTPTTSAPMATPAVPTPTQSPTHVHESPSASPPPQLRRSARVRKPSRIVRDLQAGEGTAPTRGLQFPNPPTEDVEEAGGVWAVVDGMSELLEDFEGLEDVFAAETADTEAMEPRTLAEAKRRPDWPQWERAIEEELATLKAASTWRLEEAPPGANIIGSKWVFKAKEDAVGNIAR